MQKNLTRFVRQSLFVLLGTFVLAILSGSVFAASAARAAMPDLTSLVEKTSPAVVFIMNKVNVPKKQQPKSSPGLLSRLFGKKQEEKQEVLPGEPEKVMASGGSGFIITPDGYILTNQHVVAGADELVAKLKDGRYFRAEVVGADKTTDVALLKINNNRDLPYLKTGRSADVKAGQWVMAIGSPLFLQDSVSFGVVSNKSRDRGQYLPFIQMDVAVNHGNSGGPAINMAGEVIGINSRIVTETGGFAGISLAIPIDEALKIASELKKNGSVTRGRMGITTWAMDKELAESKHFSHEYGVFIVNIKKGSPAEKAGIKPGDIILQFDKHIVYHPLELIRLIGNSKPGKIVHLHVWRDGREINVNVEIAKSMIDGSKEAYFTVE